MASAGSFPLTEPQELTHEVANEVQAALRKGRVRRDDVQHLVVAHEIGPALELGIALANDPADGACQPPWSAGWNLSAFADALRRGRPMWTSRAANGLGFYRTLQEPETRDERYHAVFRFRAQQAAEASGFPRRTAQALVGAMGEIEGNIYEHSGLHRSGILAFQGGPAVFTFVIADAGMGVLASLRQSPQFRMLDDHGDALRLALTDGVSRLSHTDPARGMGFHDLFVGLASMRGSLRFASGDHALIIDGASPSLAAHHLMHKEQGRGFVASVTCRA